MRTEFNFEAGGAGGGWGVEGSFLVGEIFLGNSIFL